MISLLVLLTLVTAPSFALAQQAEAPLSTIPGEGIYPRSSREVWDHAKAVLQKAGFKSERQDSKNQIFVTQWRSYDTERFPPLTSDPAYRVRRVQLHLMVAPQLEPARVVVGAIVETERRVQNRNETLLMYRANALEQWFLDALDAEVGVKHEPMASTFDARAEQAKRLGNASPPCVPAPGGGRPAAPVKLSDVRPVFPAQGFGSGEGKVWLQAVITEHGSLINLRIVNPSQQYAHYESSARGAVSLWRFKAPSQGGCPISTLFTVSVSYNIR